MLGKILPEFFPSVFGATGDEPLDRNAALQSFAELSRQICESTGKPMSPEAIAEGLYKNSRR